MDPLSRILFSYCCTISKRFPSLFCGFIFLMSLYFFDFRPLHQATWCIKLRCLSKPFKLCPLPLCIHLIWPKSRLQIPALTKTWLVLSIFNFGGLNHHTVKQVTFYIGLSQLTLLSTNVLFVGACVGYWEPLSQWLVLWNCQLHGH